jgi:hypothetical protein
MKLTWGTHPNNIGHDDFLGCFRCTTVKTQGRRRPGHQRRLLRLPPGPRDGRRTRRVLADLGLK